MSSFAETDCFLMPHPGLKVANGASRGATCDLEDDFVTELKVIAVFTSTFWRMTKITKSQTTNYKIT
jgi:hypothetical protein